MVANAVDLGESLTALESLTIDEFSRKVIKGASGALADHANPLRFNFFCVAMRILFEHTTGKLSPDELVRQCAWFKANDDAGRPTRAQKVQYAVQGGLTDLFVQKNLDVDAASLRRPLISAVDELSKQVHGRETNLIEGLEAQYSAVENVIKAMHAFLSAYHDCRNAIIDPIREELDDAAVDALISETVLAVDELASHHSVDEVYIHNIEVHEIGPSTVKYRAVGSLSVTLQWGSNSDLRNGDGAELEEGFPFQCDIEAPLDSPWNLDLADTMYEVDTSSWFGHEPE
ncbi:MAG: hypothetical protein EPO08_01775 [Rhodospirillaceae bacterium]|nr:MAG: hypothetical protein EPO08_01775 [Rhodospirillaceae bacterium]